MNVFTSYPVYGSILLLWCKWNVISLLRQKIIILSYNNKNVDYSKLPLKLFSFSSKFCFLHKVKNDMVQKVHPHILVKWIHCFHNYNSNKIILQLKIIVRKFLYTVYWFPNYCIPTHYRSIAVKNHLFSVYISDENLRNYRFIHTLLFKTNLNLSFMRTILLCKMFTYVSHAKSLNSFLITRNSKAW